MRETLNLWARMEFRELWETVRLRKGRTAARVAEFVPDYQEDLAACKRNCMTKYAKEGASTKGMRASSSLGLAFNSVVTLSALRLLQPERSGFISSPPCFESGATPADDNLLMVDQEAVREAIMTFERRFAGGPTGLASEHLRSLLSSSIDGYVSPETVKRFLEKMTEVFHVLLNGLSLPSLAPYICGAN